jgi:hypothetical protein
VITEQHRATAEGASSASQDMAEELAQAIITRGWNAPATLLLEMMRPLSFVGSQLLLVIEPLAGPSAQGRSMRRYAEWLQDRRNVDLLLQRIEAHHQGTASDAAAREEDACRSWR